jgi:hypothetical protein
MKIAAASAQSKATNQQAPNLASELAINPTVTKRGAKLEFSVRDVPYKQIQKVEFYVEQHMVGAVFSEPYKVTISENSLSEGAHTVVAKIYTSDSTASSSPANFTAKPTVAPAPAADSDAGTVTGSATKTQPITLSKQLPTPTDVSGSASADGKSVAITWSAVAGATSYSVWRDNVQIGTVLDAAYTDSAVTPGVTYDYRIVAVAGPVSSDSSQPVAVTVPNPHVLGDTTTDAGIAPNDQATKGTPPAATN